MKCVFTVLVSASILFFGCGSVDDADETDCAPVDAGVDVAPLETAEGGAQSP